MKSLVLACASAFWFFSCSEPNGGGGNPPVNNFIGTWYGYSVTLTMQADTWNAGELGNGTYTFDVDIATLRKDNLLFATAVLSQNNTVLTLHRLEQESIVLSRDSSPSNGGGNGNGGENGNENNVARFFCFNDVLIYYSVCAEEDEEKCGSTGSHWRRITEPVQIEDTLGKVWHKVTSGYRFNAIE